MSIDPNLMHDLRVCSSILTGFGGTVAGIWKLVTNHMWHMKKDIIENSDANRVKVVNAINESNKDNVQAIQLAAKDIVIAVLKEKQ